jgi:hypothetical protein
MIYWKRGRVARWEHGRVVTVSESGLAVDVRGAFVVTPGCRSLDAALDDMADDVASVAKPLLRMKPERLIVSHGVAEHEYNGVRWREETRRLHVALTHNHLRALVDRADFDVEEVAKIAHALRRAGAERDAPPRLRLAPSVSAALLPQLIGVAPANVRLVQSGGGLDGNGEEIREAAGPPWPNVFRPSYRFRPVRTALNLRLECDVDAVDHDLPEAIALLAPVAGLMLRVLVADSGRFYPATIRVTRIDAVGRDRTWYPYGAGAFGSEIML